MWWNRVLIERQSQESMCVFVCVADGMRWVLEGTDSYGASDT